MPTGQAFRYFGGVPRRGLYDNMSTTVDKVLDGKARDYNPRCAQMAAHYLFEPQACIVASGWEKGQVERQVSLVRGWLFVPRLKFRDLLALNAWLARRCTELAVERPHPEQQQRSVAEVFGDEAPLLGTLPAMFDGFSERSCSPSPQALVRFDRPRRAFPLYVAVRAMNKVRVVDDDAGVREGLAALLESADLEVACHASAEAFLNAFQADPPECLVLDLRMPGKSGIELQAELQRRGAAIPIIFLTAHGDIPTTVRAIKAGAMEFLTTVFESFPTCSRLPLATPIKYLYV